MFPPAAATPSDSCAAALTAEVQARRDHAVAEWPGLGGEDVPAVAVPGLDPTVFPLTVAPREETALLRVPPRRRRALAAHLRRMAAAALVPRAPDVAGLDPAGLDAGPTPAAPEPASAPLTDDEARLLGGACGGCGGRCCRQGGDHGYVSADTVRGYLVAHPSLGEQQVVTAYLARVPAAAVRGSCVFHTADGCGLPRAMRSDVCNRFFCEGLVELRRDLTRRTAAGAPARAAFVAVVEEGRVTRGALVGAGDA